MSGVTSACSHANIRPVAESGQHFIGDEEHAKAIAEAAHAGEKFRRPDDHAAGTLQHRLDDDGRRGVANRRQRLLEAGKTINLACRALESGSDTGSEGAGAHHREQQVNGRVKIESSLHRHRADGVAVIRVVKRDERLAPRLVPC